MMQSFCVCDVGRIHASFNQLGAASGRFSCENPNLQQIPRMKAFRQCFRAADGYAFVVADFSQIELRIAADVASDQRMIQAFARVLCSDCDDNAVRLRCFTTQLNFAAAPEHNAFSLCSE